MADYIYYNGELYHASKKKHKYIAKVSVGKGKYRYFYTKDEYQAYLDSKNQDKKEAKKKKKTVSGFFKNLGNKIKNLFNKSKKQLSKTVDKGKKFVDEVIFGKKQGLKSKFKNSEKTFKYIKRVKMSNGKYRYFYEQDEYDRYLKSQKYLENEPGFMKKISKISEDDSFAVEDNMKVINPGYSRYDKSTSYNCSNCTAAYELRCRGYDVKAAEYKNVGEYFLNGLIYRFSYYYKDAKSIMLDDSGNEHKSIFKGTRYQKEFDYSARSVEAGIVKNSGKNTRGDITVEWKQGSAHSMVYEVDNNGTVRIRDCQTNRVYRVSDLTDDVKNIIITRTDNLELKEGILNAVKER